MAERHLIVKCPECGQDDGTTVELEDWTTEYYVVTECAHCTNPYALGVHIIVNSQAYRIIKAD